MCNKLLTISDYAFSGCKKVSSIKLPEGLTYIGQYSFSSAAISSFIIPSTVKTISPWAFVSCNSLTAVELAIPSSMGTLHANAFANCPIKAFHFPASITKANCGAFSGNSVLSSISVDPNSMHLWTDGKSLYSYDWKTLIYVASACTGDYRVANGVETINTCCFISTKLSSVWFPDTVTTIGSYAFLYGSINSVTMQNSIVKIEYAVFIGCTNLNSIDLPTSLQEIPNNLFENSGLTSIVIPEGVTKIGKSAFAKCYNLVTIQMPSTLKELGGGVTSGSPKAKYVFMGNSSVYILNEVLLIDRDNTSVSQYFGTDQTTVFIPSTVKTIRSHAFEGKNKLHTVTSDGDISLEYIEEYAFSGCTSLTNFFKFDSVRVISTNAFQSTSIRAPITFGDKLTYIDTRAFYNNKFIQSLTFRSSGDLYIGDESFMNCISISSISIDDCEGSVTLGNNVFRGITGLSSVNIPNCITSIGFNCFSYCGLVSVTFEGDIISFSRIPTGMFMDCRSLASLRLPSNCISIGQSSFQNTNITNVTIPDSVQIFGQECFKDCVNLKSVNITDNSNLSRIDYGVFSGCIRFSYINAFHAKNFVCSFGALYNAAMTKMYIYPPASPSKFFALSESVTFIAETAFIGCINLESVLIPDNSVETIGSRAFEGCINLRNINIPICVKQVGEGAFHGCSRLLCGSVNFQNKTTSFFNQLRLSGLSKQSLYECANITCISTYYSFRHCHFMLLS